jgi:hypothetical protein
MGNLGFRTIFKNINSVPNIGDTIGLRPSQIVFSLGSRKFDDIFEVNKKDLGFDYCEFEFKVIKVKRSYTKGFSDTEEEIRVTITPTEHLMATLDFGAALTKLIEIQKKESDKRSND